MRKYELTYDNVLDLTINLIGSLQVIKIVFGLICYFYHKKLQMILMVNKIHGKKYGFKFRDFFYGFSLEKIL
jgi:hypothetical protein